MAQTRLQEKRFLLSSQRGEGTIRHATAMELQELQEKSCGEEEINSSGLGLKSQIQEVEEEHTHTK